MARDRGRERVVGPFGLQRLLVLALARLVLELADERRGWGVWDPGADPSNGTGAVGEPEIAIRPRGDSVRRAAGIEAGAELGDLPAVPIRPIAAVVPESANQREPSGPAAI